MCVYICVCIYFCISGEAIWGKRRVHKGGTDKKFHSIPFK